MKEQYYQLTLDDYSSPSFVSSYKNFYGTLEEIGGLIQAIKDDEKPEHFKNLIDAYDEFVAGNQEVTHSVAFSEWKFLKPVTVSESSEIHLSGHKWKHINTWDCPYYMSCDKADIQVKHFRVDGRVVKAYKAIFRGLKYGAAEGNYCDVGSLFWGFPHMLESENGVIFNRLYVANTNQEDDGIIDFSAFCDEIFGEG